MKSFDSPLPVLQTETDIWGIGRVRGLSSKQISTSNDTSNDKNIHQSVSWPSGLQRTTSPLAKVSERPVMRQSMANERTLIADTTNMYKTIRVTSAIMRH